MAADLPITTTIVSDFDPLKDFMYRVKAYNAGGYSDPSTTISVLAKHRELLLELLFELVIGLVIELVIKLVMDLVI